jgi:PucR family transcriptional regulator, purine catabolism regulatory protein
MPITVAEALRTDGLASARVLAGHAGLNRRVETVAVLESPDIFPWLHGQELVLTSLYAVRDLPEQQGALVERLARRGCAGLVIKVGRYVDQVPAEILGPADQLDFPVLELPTSVRYAHVINPLVERILVDRSRLLRHSDSIHRSLTRAALTGGGLGAVAQAFSDLVGCRAAVVDSALRCLAADRGVQRAGLSAWLEVHDPMSPQWRGASAPAGEVAGPEGSRAAVVPVRVDEETLGYILLWPLRLPLEPENLVAVEHAVTVAALEFLKLRAVVQVERRYHDEVLSDLIHGRVLGEQDLEQRARHLEWDLKVRYRVLLLDLAPLRAEPRAEMLRQAALDAAHRTVRGLTPRPIVGLVQSDLAVLVPEGPATRLPAETEALARAVQFQAAHLSTGAKATVGISERVAGLLELNRPYSEARDALEIGRLVNGPGAIANFAQLGVYRLLKDVSPALAREFVDGVIGPVIEQDRLKGSALLETLERYLQVNGEAKAAAERLYVHVNTVKYRLHQIEELTGHSPDTSEGRSNLVLALKLLSLSGNRNRQRP